MRHAGSVHVWGSSTKYKLGGYSPCILNVNKVDYIGVEPRTSHDNDDQHEQRWPIMTRDRAVVEVTITTTTASVAIEVCLQIERHLKA